MNDHFEVHLTLEDSHSRSSETLRDIFLSKGIKTIFVESIKDGEVILKDFMTSKRYSNTTLETVRMEIFKDIVKISDMGINVIRVKIESSLEYQNPTIWKFPYLETHIPIVVPKWYYDEKFLEISEFLKTFNFHLSKNAFKRHENDITLMATLRMEDSEENRSGISKYTSGVILLLLLNFDKLEVDQSNLEYELCVYDSNQDRDKIWLKG